MSADFRNVKQLSRQQSQESWLTKDRFWNFIFWFGMSGGFSLAFFLHSKNLEYRFDSLVCWVTIIGIPFLTRFFSQTTFIKDDLFINSENKEIDLDKDFPNIFAIILSTIVITFLAGFILNKLQLADTTLGISIIFGSIFGIPSLFFIYKNCPISILFNRNMWKIEPGSIDDTKKYDHFMRNNHNTNSDRFNVTSNPAYGSLSSNIYNKYR